jgi:hypothetical protein
MPTITVPANSHSITSADAIAMTTRYRANRDSVLQTAYQNLDLLALSDTLNKEALRRLMDDEECKGFRIYYGMDEDLKVHPIIVGVDADNEDMLPALESFSSTVEPDYTITDDTQRCPPMCPPPSYLNQD